MARRADAADLGSVTALTQTGRPPPGRPRRSHLRPSGSRRLPARPDPGPPGSAASRNTPPGGKHTDRAFTGHPMVLNYTMRMGLNKTNTDKLLKQH